MPEIKGEELIKNLLPDFEVTPETKLEDVVKELGEKYVPIDTHTKGINEQKRIYMSKGESQVKKILKGLGVDESELNGKKLEDLAAISETKIQEFSAKTTELSERIKELEEKGGSATGKEKAELDALKKEFSEHKKLAGDKDKKILELTQALEIEKTSSATKIAAAELSRTVTSLYDSAKWTTDSDEIDKKGIWASDVENKVIFKADGGKVYVYNNDEEQTMIKDGVAGQLTAEKFFENLLKKHKRYQENKGNPNPFQFKTDPEKEKTKTPQQIAHEKAIEDNLKKMAPKP